MVASPPSRKVPTSSMSDTASVSLSAKIRKEKGIWFVWVQLPNGKKKSDHSSGSPIKIQKKKSDS